MPIIMPGSLSPAEQVPRNDPAPPVAPADPEIAAHTILGDTAHGGLASQAELDTHAALGDTAHGGLASQAELTAHEADTTNIHGIVDSANLALLTREIVGQITGAGAITRGTGFTVVRNSVGVYTVTFNPARATVPVVVVSSCAAGAPIAVITTVPTINSFGVSLVDVNGAVADVAWSFIAIAVGNA